MQVRNKLRSSIKKAIKNLQESGKLPRGSFNRIKIERPNRDGHGDYATSIAMAVAASAKRKPKTIAKIIIEELEKDESLAKVFKNIQVAAPGFINFYFSDNYLTRQLSVILKEDNFGEVNVGRGKKLNLEFISVNPTGELHIGHGRSAFYGDVLANILSLASFRVTREYYINNARQSAQIKELGKTVLKRGTSYKGPYLDRKIKQYLEKLKTFKKPNVAGYFIANRIQKDIRDFLTKKAHIKFDVWTQEENLYKDNSVEHAFKAIKKSGLAYEEDGAWWMRTKRYGDNQDQVLVRSSGENIYFMADIAYHLDKKKRGYDKLIDIWGADHQGHVRKMQAAMKAFGVRDLDLLITQLVSLKGRLRLSKRKGNIITLEDLLDVVGLDVVRYFYLTKSLDTQMEFDLALARKQSQKNPVFYIQYTHARICSILKKAMPKNKILEVKPKILELLTEKGELDLIKKLVIFPDIIEDIASDYQVHRLTTYVHELAQEFNRFYRDFRVLNDNEKLQNARLVLISATGLVIKKSLDLLGISAPNKM